LFCRKNHHGCRSSVLRSCHGRSVLAVCQPSPCRPGIFRIRLGLPHHIARWPPSIHQRCSFRPPIRAPTVQPSTENSIASGRAYSHHRVQSNEVSASASAAEAVKSVCCAQHTSRFCELYGEWRRRLSPTMRQTYMAGDKLFVDWAGGRVPIIDPMPDNLKAGITKPSRYEPGVNRTYQDLADHYGFVVLPARVRRPRDKAKVEAASSRASCSASCATGASSPWSS
jgi:hypothetical protein